MDALMPGITNAPNLHPLFVHAPMVLWPLALAFLGAGMLRGREAWMATARLLLYLGTLGGFAALFSGTLAADSLGHDSPGHDLVHVHRNLMLVAMGLALTASMVAFLTRNRTDRAVRATLLVLLLATTGVVLAGADRGAYLVFGLGTGVRQDAGAREGSHAPHEYGASDGHHHGGEAQEPHDESAGPGTEQPRDEALKPHDHDSTPHEH